MANDMKTLFEVMDKEYPNYMKNTELNSMGFDLHLVGTIKSRGFLESEQYNDDETGKFKAGNWMYRLTPIGYQFLLQMRINEEIKNMGIHTQEMKKILFEFKSISVKSSKTTTKMTWITIILASLTLLLTATQVMRVLFPIN